MDDGLPACTGRRRTPVPDSGVRTPARLGKDRAPCAGITQIRFEGLRCDPHSQRCALPCRMYVSTTLTRGGPLMQIEARGLTFDVYEGGPPDGPAVLLLHGFPQDHREFELMAPRLHEAGLRTIALDQRGFSPGARPAEVSAYRLTESLAEAVAVLDPLGVAKAHLV